MIEYLKDGRRFNEGGCGVSTYYREIKRSEYERLEKMSYTEVDAEIIEGLDEATLCGYGYYGHILCMKFGGYFLGKKIGNSCD